MRCSDLFLWSFFSALKRICKCYYESSYSSSCVTICLVNRSKWRQMSRQYKLYLNSWEMISIKSYFCADITWKLYKWVYKLLIAYDFDEPSFVYSARSSFSGLNAVSISEAAPFCPAAPNLDQLWSLQISLIKNC